MFFEIYIKSNIFFCCLLKLKADNVIIDYFFIEMLEIAKNNTYRDGLLNFITCFIIN